MSAPGRRLPFPIKSKELLSLCIEDQGFTNDERLYWWPVFARHQEGQEVNTYPSAQIALVQLSEVASQKNVKASGPDGAFTMADVFHLLIETFRLKEPKYLRRIFKLVAGQLMNYPNGPAITHSIFEIMLKNKAKYGDFTATSLRLHETVFTTAALKSMYKTSMMLKQMHTFDHEHLNLLFFDFFQKILPLPYVLRIIDAYLLEGSKAIYRYGLGLIHIHKQQIKGLNFHSGEDFWNFLKRRKARFTSSEFDTIHHFAYAFELQKRMTLGIFRKSSVNLSNKQLVGWMDDVKVEKRSFSNEHDIEEEDDSQWLDLPASSSKNKKRTSKERLKAGDEVHNVLSNAEGGEEREGADGDGGALEEIQLEEGEKDDKEWEQNEERNRSILEDSSEEGEVNSLADEASEKDNAASEHLKPVEAVQPAQSSCCCWGARQRKS